MDVDILNYDFRRFDAEHAISSLRTYIRLMDAQLTETHRLERLARETEGPAGGSEEDYDFWRQELGAIDEMFEQQLVPAMRYSFVGLVHTVFEIRLRAFCGDIQRAKKIPIGSRELKGGLVEQTRLFLEKLVGFKVADYPEWAELLRWQKIRNFIVHANGDISELADDSRRKEVRKLVAEQIGLSLTDYDRLVVSREACEAYLSCAEGFFRRLFDAAGWASGEPTHSPRHEHENDGPAQA